LVILGIVLVMIPDRCWQVKKMAGEQGPRGVPV